MRQLFYLILTKIFREYTKYKLIFRKMDFFNSQKIKLLQIVL